MDDSEVDLTRRGYDAVARSYASEIADELPGKPLDRAVLDVVVELAAGGLIADIGCGPGHVAAHLAGPRSSRCIRSFISTHRGGWPPIANSPGPCGAQATR